MSSIRQLSFEKVLQAPRDIHTAYENKAGPISPADFSHYSNTFHPKYLQIKHYESILMTESCISSFYEFSLNF